MKHAYLIIAHNNFYTLKRLLMMLDNEHNDIFLHIGKHIKNVPFDEFRNSVKTSKLIFTKRIAVYWGHSSQVDCEMLLLKTAAKAGKYDYYHLLSGVDLPIKTNGYIYEFFKENNGKEFLQVGYAENHLWRLDEYNFFFKKRTKTSEKLRRKIAYIIRNKLNISRIARYKGMKFCKTANWFSLTDGCVRYIISKEKFIRRLTRHTICADEMFLGTVIINSPFFENVYKKEPSWDGHMRYIDRINNEGSSPHTFVMEDKEKIMNSDMLFARKFDENRDKEIIDFVYNKFKQG